MGCDGRCSNPILCTCNSQSTGCLNGMPYYGNAPSVQESHTQVINTQTFSAAISNATAFNVPSCGGALTTVFPNVTKLQVGSYLWNAAYGYLEVAAYNPSNGQASIKNNCTIGNASPGTQIPACTLFTVVDPPSANDNCSDSVCYLMADFIAPNYLYGEYIQVNNIIGIVQYQDVQIGQYVYFVTAIVSNTEILITNKGNGAVPGTTIYAKDSLGHCITPLTYIAPAVTNAYIDTAGVNICHSNLSSAQFVNATDAGIYDTGYLTGSGSTFTGRYNEFLAINTTCNILYVMLTLDYGLYGVFEEMYEGDWARMVFRAKYAAETIPNASPLNPITPYQVQAFIKDTVAGQGYNTPGSLPTRCRVQPYPYNDQYTMAGGFAIPSGFKLHVKAETELFMEAFSPDDRLAVKCCCPAYGGYGYRIDRMYTTLSSIQVALQSTAN